MAQQNRELAQQKAGNERLKEQVGDLSTLQIIQVAKKTQQKKPAGTKKPSAGTKKPTGGTKKPAGGTKKPAGGTKKTPQKRKAASDGVEPVTKKVGCLLHLCLVCCKEA